VPTGTTAFFSPDFWNLAISDKHGQPGWKASVQDGPKKYKE